jgi:hypothetical protein
MNNSRRFDKYALVVLSFKVVHDYQIIMLGYNTRQEQYWVIFLTKLSIYFLSHV